MKASSQKCELNDYILKHIDFKAHQLLDKPGFTADDLEDIKQELILALWQSLPKYDPARASYNTYMIRVVEGQICKLLRYPKIKKRDYRQEGGSLHEEVPHAPEEGALRVNTIKQNDLDRHRGVSRRSEVQLQDLRVDLNLALADLPADLRRVAELLKFQSFEQAAAQLQISRSTLYCYQLARLRLALKIKGLDEYFFPDR